MCLVVRSGARVFRVFACFRFVVDKAASPVVYGVKQLKSVANARAVEGPAWFADEPSQDVRLVVRAGARIFCVLAWFRFAADKAASTVAYGVKQSKSVANARAVEGPA